VIPVPRPATASSWRHQPFRDGVPLPCAIRLGRAASERLRCGLVPEDMDDRWFVFHEAPHVYFHRSWSGQPVYRVTLAADGDETTVSEALWAAELASPAEADRAREGAVLARLIEVLFAAAR
jgi:hypothetical protein